MMMIVVNRIIRRQRYSYYHYNCYHNDINIDNNDQSLEPFESLIIYEDNHMLVVNKPNGILSQSDNNNTISILDHAKRYIKSRYSKPGDVFIGLVHRLDRPSSGALILG